MLPQPHSEIQIGGCTVLAPSSRMSVPVYMPTTLPHRDTDAQRLGLTPAPHGVVRVFICSRNRPSTLRCCIGALSHALREAALDRQAICYIVDDSTTPEFSAQVHAIAGTKGLQLAIIDRSRQAAINEQLSRLDAEPSRILRSATRKLGEGPWDLAGVRNLAFLLAYCYSDEDDTVVFLDDDILLTDEVYRGRLVEVDGASLLRELLASTYPRRLVASGAAYSGQFDGSILDHLRMVSEETLTRLSRDPNGGDPRAKDLLEELSLFPSTLPVQRACAGSGDSIEGPGISGALLATTPAALHSHFLPSCYNEDWIWLALLGRAGTEIRRVSCRALHASPPQQEIGWAILDYQNAGEVVYRAVRSTLDGGQFGYSALERCEETISTEHFLSAKQNLMGEMRALLDLRACLDRSLSRWPDGGALRASARSALAGIEQSVGNALGRFDGLDPAALHLWFRRYLADVPAWRDLLVKAREKLDPDR